MVTQMRRGNLKASEFHHLWRSTYLLDRRPPSRPAPLRPRVRPEIFQGTPPPTPNTHSYTPHWASDNGPLVAEDPSWGGMKGWGGGCCGAPLFKENRGSGSSPHNLMTLQDFYSKEWARGGAQLQKQDINKISVHVLDSSRSRPVSCINASMQLPNWTSEPRPGLSGSAATSPESLEPSPNIPGRTWDWKDVNFEKPLRYL